MPVMNHDAFVLLPFRLIFPQPYKQIAGVPVKDYFRNKEKARYTPRKAKVDQETITSIRNLHRQRVSQLRIAKKLGVSVYLVRKTLQTRQVTIG
jgi:hypothetical protein